MAKKLVLFIVVLLFPGCMTVAPLVVSGVGSGATYSFFSTACKTETYPLKNVYRACMQALRTMELNVHSVSRDKQEIAVKAQAGKRKVVLVLETVTPAATRVTINVSKALLLSDKATAEEIIHQMDLALKKTGAHRLRRHATLALSLDPPDALVRILNIKPPFYQGIELKQGVYELSVSAEEYIRKRMLITLLPGQDKIIQVSLKKRKQ
jgi:hypothetical protein